MLRAAVLLATFLMLPPPAASAGQVLCRNEADDIAALQMFDRAINGYVEMTRRLEVPSSPWIASDLEAMAVASDSLARAIATERQGALQGDIFGPEVADFFRVRIQAAGWRKGRQHAFARCGEQAEDARCVPASALHSRLAWAWSAPIGGALARALPALPLELQYRLSPDGTVLFLVDVRAAIVIDLMDV